MSKAFDEIVNLLRKNVKGVKDLANESSELIQNLKYTAFPDNNNPSINQSTTQIIDYLKNILPASVDLENGRICQLIQFLPGDLTRILKKEYPSIDEFRSELQHFLEDINIIIKKYPLLSASTNPSDSINVYLRTLENVSQTDLLSRAHVEAIRKFCTNFIQQNEHNHKQERSESFMENLDAIQVISIILEKGNSLHKCIPFELKLIPILLAQPKYLHLPPT